jgi:hypothetical protein
MKVSEAYPSKYLKCVDLDGKSVQYTIKIAIEVLMGLPGEKQEKKPVLFFEEEPRGFVLNRTNANTIADLYGDDTDDWSGQQIVLYPDRAAYLGKMHDVIRVHAPAKGNRRPPDAKGDDFADEIPF